MIKAAEEGQQIDLSEMPPAPWELPAETTPASPSPALQSAANTIPGSKEILDRNSKTGGQSGADGG